MKYYYILWPYSENPPKEFDKETAFVFESKWSKEELEWVATDAAEDYYNSDYGSWTEGCEDFAIYNEKGKLLGCYSIELEFEPSFTVLCDNMMECSAS